MKKKLALLCGCAVLLVACSSNPAPAAPANQGTGSPTGSLNLGEFFSGNSSSGETDAPGSGSTSAATTEGSVDVSPMSPDENMTNALGLEQMDSSQVDWTNPYELPESAMFERLLSIEEMPEFRIEGILVNQDTTVQDLLNAGFEIADTSDWDASPEGYTYSMGVDYSLNGNRVTLLTCKWKGRSLQEQRFRQFDTYHANVDMTVDGLKNGDTYFDMIEKYGQPSSVKIEKFENPATTYWTFKYNSESKEGFSYSLVVDLQVVGEEKGLDLESIPKITAIWLMFHRE